MNNGYFFNDAFLMLCLFLTLLLPLMSSILSFATSDRYSWLIILNAPFLLLLSAIFSLIVIINCWNNPAGMISVSWIDIDEMRISANLALSNNALLMMTTVSIISFLVHLYSVGYMAGDDNPRKYFGVLGLFTFAMQGIVLSDNLLVLFIFWELVGFSSYLLIGHWNQKDEAAKAATKAFLFNRIGDAAFLIGLMIIWSKTGTFEITTILKNLSFEWQTIAGLCVFAGVIGKSAQFPLFTWLPDAMEGPTPVSALIHAATMVAAGVYLLIRLFPLFTETALIVITVVGSITAMTASVSAFFQFDIKRILAYSTISQLGLMTVIIGLGGAQAAFLHLLTHAFFKACLFLSAGSVIHTLHQAQRRDHHHFDVQDIRNLGGLRKKLPITFLTFVISAAALAGIPFFSGFISKEAMYSAILASDSQYAWAMFVIMAISSLFTILYSFRMIWHIFMSESRKPVIATVAEAPVIMRIPLMILALGSFWLVASWNPFDSSAWISPSLASYWWLPVFSILWLLLGLAIGYVFFKKPRLIDNKFIRDGYELDRVYNVVIKRSSEKLAHAVEWTDEKIIDRAIHTSAYGHVTLAHVIGWVDKNIIDGVVHFVSGIVRWIGGLARSFQSGKIQDYILYGIIALIIFIIWAL